MNKQKAKILMPVEGEKTDVVLMKHLLDIYGISDRHQIVSYNTNIYVLYNRMFKEDALIHWICFKYSKRMRRMKQRRRSLTNITLIYY